MTKEEHQSLEGLFSHLLFQEGGVYTLFADKPISFDIISEIPSEEKEEFLSTQSSHIILQNSLNFKQNWETWERVKGHFQISRYLFVKRKSPAFSSYPEAIFLVNILATASILNKYYSLFKEVAGFDFEPIDIVFEIENNGSLFWEKVLNNHKLLGILLGFGKDNATLFEKLLKYEQRVGDKKQKKSFFFQSLAEQNPGSNSLSSFWDLFFPLPSFSCYSESESIRLIKKYEKQRNRIRKIYKRKDLVNVSLKRLTSQDLPIDPDETYRHWMGKKLGIKDN